MIAVLLISMIYLYCLSIIYSDRLSYYVTVIDDQDYYKLSQNIENTKLVDEYCMSFSEYVEIETTTQRSLEINLTQATPSWVKINPMNLTRGRFFENEEINYIVLEYDAAIQLFMTDDCLLENVYINGEEYIVRGVYKRSNNPINFLSFYKGYEAFIPMNNINKNKFTLEVVTSPNSGEFLRNEINNKLSTYILAEASPFKIVRTIEFVFKLFLSIAYIMFNIKWFNIAKSICKRDLNLLKKSYKENYFKDWIIKNYNHLLALVLVIIVSSVSFGIFVAYLLPYLNVPYEILPHRLINYQEWVENTKRYIEQVNTTRVFNYGINKYLFYIKNIIIICGILLCHVIWRILYKLIPKESFEY